MGKESPVFYTKRGQIGFSILFSSLEIVTGQVKLICLCHCRFIMEMLSVLLLPLLLRRMLLSVQKKKERNQFSSTLTDYLCISMALYHHGTQVLGPWQYIGNKNIKTTALCDEARMNSRTRVF